MGEAVPAGMSGGVAAAPERLLRLEGFGVAYGDRVVLSDVTLSCAPRGVLTVLGPGGAGKSTLLRALVGAAGRPPYFSTWGTAELGGVPLESAPRPALVVQNAQRLVGTVYEAVASGLPDRALLPRAEQAGRIRALLTEAGLGTLGGALGQEVLELSLGTQRRLALVRCCAANPALVMLDEPTAGLCEPEAEALLEHLRGEATRRAVLFVTHHQGHARKLGGQVALLAGGRVQEVRPCEAFFTAPRSEAGRQFLQTGGCAVPSPTAVAEELDEGVPPPPPLPAAAVRAVQRAAGPQGFHWLRRGALAGTPRPGLLAELEHDLERLVAAGVTVLVTVEDTPPPAAALARHGLRARYFPCRDMQAPSLDEAREQCAEVQALLEAGEAVAIHCRAGLGRTGTALAAQLIWEGCSAEQALQDVRRVEAQWVQSEAQERFLHLFAKACADPAFRLRCPPSPQEKSS
ncbi:ATP-binding cassette domain-containing protein [Myxococcus sp. RHSTA-1-4]|uniref:phosphatase domain-containing putative toxin n=1 Tax=Myxococcus sp. RHSTA-1-4 TaxID=2874601 RepID=UPI001CBC0DD6|nr:ATP-binding cassette domain-containing protein [Myxococcus sp. RHSTA-1-4]MBZ4420565.1 ATP-binding cassette domain-containing protein [Myxococcus sp. RHSTA-1-4]